MSIPQCPIFVSMLTNAKNIAKTISPQPIQGRYEIIFEIGLILSDPLLLLMYTAKKQTLAQTREYINCDGLDNLNMKLLKLGEKNAVNNPKITIKLTALNRVVDFCFDFMDIPYSFLNCKQ